MKKEYEPWLGFDLDGTLVRYSSGDSSQCRIGESIKPMCDLVRRYLAEGWRIKIFTARVSHEGKSWADRTQQLKTIGAIRAWSRKEFGKSLEVTCRKDYQMVALFDDRAIAVEPDTGKLLSPLPKQLA